MTSYIITPSAGNNTTMNQPIFVAIKPWIFPTPGNLIATLPIMSSYLAVALSAEGLKSPLVTYSYVPSSFLIIFITLWVTVKPLLIELVELNVITSPTL